MFSHPRQPENAATCARVSDPPPDNGSLPDSPPEPRPESLPLPIAHPSATTPSATLASPGNPIVPSISDHGTAAATDAAPAPFPSLTGPSSSPSSVTEDVSTSALSAAVISPAVSAPPVISAPSSLPSVLPSALPSVVPSSAVAASNGSVDHDNKRPRPPLPLSRSNGPSLLTQALASARGKPPSTTLQTEPRRLDNKSSTPSDDQLRPLQLANDPDEPEELPNSNTQHAISASSRGGSLTPATLLRRIDAHRMATAPTMPRSIYSGDSRDVAVSVAMPTMTELAATSARGYYSNPLATRARGRSLGRTEKEAGVFMFNQSGLHCDNIGDTAFRRADSSISIQDVSDIDANPRAQYRAWRADEHMSMGPEKVWSIGTSDAAGHQDGQVEKSIAEVLSGMEPTRSRKASHSLRFFKEGLPVDKGKRKESKPTQQREKQPSLKAAQEDGQQKIPAVEEEAVDETQSPGHPTENLKQLSRDTVAPSSISAVENIPSKSNNADYFSPQKGESPAFEQSQTRNPTEDPLPTFSTHDGLRAGLDAAEEAAKQRRTESGALTEIEGVNEEGEDSSEEKISSAVFLPHPGLEQSAEKTPCGIEKVEPISRRPSTQEFTPWLVKADEPEAEGDSANDSVEGHMTNGRKTSVAHTQDLPSKVSNDSTCGDDVKLQKKSRDTTASTSRRLSRLHEDHVHDHQLTPKVPLEAIELIPYKHQVGGHTTMWRFSKRAVCKQLNNRENEFYENIERCHRDLLPFLPRYIGVLNVTYQKQPRRKSTIKKDESSGIEIPGSEMSALSNGKSDHAIPNVRSRSTGHEDDKRRRIISQSLQSTHVPIPTVTFMDNQHILPRSLLQPAALFGQTERPRSASAATMQQHASDSSQSPFNKPNSQLIRPSLEDRHANSWGATTVNKKLRNEVFNDAFLKRPIAVHKHQTPASHHRSVPRRAMQSSQKESHAMAVASEGMDKTPSPVNLSHPLRYPASLLLSQSHIGSKTDRLDVRDAGHMKDVTGTSAPEPETFGDRFPAQVRKRRYSGSKLRRKPQEVGEPRGDLKYFEDADDVGYRGDGEPNVFSPLIESADKDEPSRPKGVVSPALLELPESGLSPAFPSAIPNPEVEMNEMPRPNNPKEAQTQRDSRVEYFLLLEDLTAGMKRPCVMDLKMGTRQYGVEAGPKKRESQRRKCAETTSRDLGVRVCGLQTWDANSETYVFRDKYFGRDLKAGREFQDTLTMFLYDGVDYASVLRHIPNLLQKINQLEMTVLRLRGYRFYAASLLMFYDAGASSNGSDAAVDDSTTDFATDTEETWEIKKRRRNKAEIDIKIADFANSVTPGDLAGDKPCPPKHPDEPDRGFLRGLSTLRKTFLQIQKDIRNDLGLVSSRKVEENGDGTMEDEDEPMSASE
ncbi:hypothetical protein GGR57DRAFT_499035 [Xylariaceae sp. FL1272]|nr:hypothetical protein GGR57DRAFT_499035 [Xylariaceae sp. FL1272]